MEDRNISNINVTIAGKTFETIWSSLDILLNNKYSKRVMNKLISMEKLV